MQFEKYVTTIYGRWRKVADRRVKKSHPSSVGVKNEWSQTPSY
jgi:hypothetical protein